MQDLYHRALNRAADTGGLNHFTSQLADGATYEQVLAEIVNSPEYVGRIGA
ncbi:MAG: DUF4214 domain-containing protein [Candidatus Saccharimonadales bacterium]